MSKDKDFNKTTTQDKADTWDSLNPLLEAMFKEFQDLSKKKPNDSLNKKKVEIVNRLLKSLMILLEDEPSKNYLEMLDEESLPSNSDVSLILGQFEASMNSFRSKYYGWDSFSGKHQWFI
jgi:hypothetical protein